ncbi:MAG: NfeD family protein [Rubripirellula sp.]
MTFLYAVLLIVAFYLLLIAEFFLPTGGVLGTAAVAALIAALVIAFSHSLWAGIGVVVFVSATTPLVILGLLRAWPHTPIGRRMLNRRPGDMGNAPPKKMTPKGTPLDDLIDRIGTAKTDLLPSGMISVDGENIDAVSTGMPIDSGTQIIVTSVEAGHVHVRPATEEDLKRDQPTPPQSPPSLENPIESFEIE